MVARALPTESDAPAVSSGVVRRVFTTWRVLLTKFAHALVAASETVSSGARHAAGASGTRIRTTARSTRGFFAVGAGEIGDSLSWLFNGWRRVVSRVLSLVRPRARFAQLRSVFVDAYALLASPTSFGALTATRADRLATFGFRAFVLGSAASLIVGLMAAGNPGPSIASVANGFLWAGARLAILLALAPRNRRTLALTTAAWGASLLPYLLGMTDELRWVALGASAFVCYGALSGAGLKRETVRTMTAWAFGGQAGVLAAGWLLRGVLAVLAAL